MARILAWRVGGAEGGPVACTAGPIPWAVTVSSSDFHQGDIILNAFFESHGSEDSDSVIRTI